MATGLPARRVLVYAVFLTAAASSPTRAERRPVAVIDLTADPAGEKLARDLVNEVVNHPDLTTVNHREFILTLMGPFADEEGPSIEAARREKAAADELLVQLDYRGAEAAALRGTQSLQNVLPSPDVLGLYAELAFATGQAELRLRKPNDASLAFALSFRLDPAKRPDPTRFEPDIVEAYTLASQKPAVPAKVDVTGTGTLWIDGVDRGTAPGTFDVGEGLHLVQLSGPERETTGRQVDVKQGVTIDIPDRAAKPELEVARARIELAHAKDPAARAGAIKRLAQLLAVGDAVLIDKAPDGTLRVQTWRDKAPGFTAPVTYKEGHALELLTPLAPPHKREPKSNQPQFFTPPIVVEKPLIRQRWFQGTLVGVGLVAAAWIIYAVERDRMLSFDPDVKPVEPPQ